MGTNGRYTGRLCASAILWTLVLALSGCGQSNETLAAHACETDAKQRSQGKMLEVDRKVLAQSATLETADTYALQAPATFDTGLQSEYTQTLNCRVQFSDGTARVIGIHFVF